MNRSKKLCILLGVLAVACAAAFGAMRLEERREQIKISGEVILDVPPESVQSLAWDCGETSLAFHKDETWRYDGDPDFPVSEEQINRLLEPFRALGAAFRIEAVEDYGQYGLDDPVCTIRLSTGERSYTVRLGDYSKMDSQRYVSIGDGAVYLVSHDLMEEFDAGLSDMIRHDEIPSFDHVAGIEISGVESRSITRRQDGGAGDAYFTLQDGKNQPLDAEKVDRYLQSITRLNPVDYVSYHVTEEELELYGLDDPRLTISIDYTAEDGEEDTFRLLVSPDPEAVQAAGEGADSGGDGEIPAYIRVGESQIVYKISPGGYEALTAVSFDDLRHAEVIWADFSDVRQMDIALEGAVYTLTAEPDGGGRIWRYQAEEVEIAGVQDSLEALTAIEFTDEQPSQKEEISLTVYLEESPSDIQIALYRYDGDRCIAVVDGESVSFVDRAAVVSLIEAVYAIVLR